MGTLGTKTDLLSFIASVPDDMYIGIYVLDKCLNILHYSVYSHAEIPVLQSKLVQYSDELDSSIMRIVDCKVSNSVEQLESVYDEMVKTMEIT